MGKQHNVVIPGPEGRPAVYPMRKWLRQHPEALEEPLDPSVATSHQLRAALRRQGWRLVELDDQVLVIKPTEQGDTTYAHALVAQGIADADELSEEEIVGAAELSFGLERDLQVAIRSDLEQLEPGLRVADEGRELVTEAGRVDIVAEDDRGQLVVIELKAAIAQPDAITQVLAYMTAVREERGQPVRAIIVARDFPANVLLAARSIPNLRLKKYGFRFTFQDAE